MKSLCLAFRKDDPINSIYTYLQITSVLNFSVLETWEFESEITFYSN